MSTDLQLPNNNLPSIRLNPIKIKLPESSSSTTENDSSSSCTVESEKLGLETVLEECQTPTSSEHKIPEIMTCPPAPKKQRMYVPSCKRKISEFELFEIVAPDEIQSFFNSSIEIIDRNSVTNKRRCHNL
ncbi:putative cyclin-dependent protein kinase inhibitor SMR [Helianthus annuus]|uniref:cyclin-dependent protein kinase inhibitor SMR2-like n=1 Tax=Helianthus annuus TaxID=4232 RepID=UPI000B8F7E9E|nr:cyclin-dependent protein kinase inhibitor SMR2-like [Helianthus annuus]KAJ0456862.1 putative cyclin-dependent protein kinase inhibitor SMR [Helianthus annuus]KAJ0845798.1 putative cyclin-dependent protein kinase inhibitor SMR [Helianthus annuus]